MKTVNIAVLAGALSMMLMGCPYESKIPIDTADKSKPDKGMLGKWSEKGDEDNMWTCEMDGNQYHITKKSTESSDDEPTVYIGWLSDVSGTPFMNVYEQDYSSDRTYMIYRVSAKGEDRYKLSAMTDNVTEEFTTGEELKAFIKKNMELSFFYNKDDEKTFYKED